MTRNLTLSIKQKYFDNILSGTKKIEIREIRPNNMEKYCQVDDEGYAIENDNGIVPAEYDTITFLTGAYKGTRPKMVVEIESAKIDLLVDEKGEFIFDKDERGEEYSAAVIEYQLGKILSSP